MPDKPEEVLTEGETKSEKVSDSSDRRSYYYDDAHGYEDFDSEDEEENSEDD